MGRPEIYQLPCNSTDAIMRKPSTDSGEEHSVDLECNHLSDDNIVSNQRHFRPLSYLNGLSQINPQQLYHLTQFYINFLEANGFHSLVYPSQHSFSSSSFTDNNSNLSLLAEVANVHSSDTNRFVRCPSSDQNFNSTKKDENSIIPNAKCKRIRNNEACRKSRLRRKLLNAAAKEKLITLTHDNDILKRRISSLEEEVNAARTTLMSRLRSQPQNTQNLLEGLLCAYNEIRNNYQVEKSTVSASELTKNSNS